MMRFHRILLRMSLAAGLLLGAAYAQEPAAAQAEAHESDPNFVWKVVNFALFAGGMGLLIVKYAPAFFNARSEDIQKAIKDATGLKMDADLRYSEIDRKMATLSDEVAVLRAQNKAEMQREYARVQAQTDDEINHIRKAAAAESDALRLEGSRQLRLFATQQALALAEGRLRSQYNASGGSELLGDFLQLVQKGKN